MFSILWLVSTILLIFVFLNVISVIYSFSPLLFFLLDYLQISQSIYSSNFKIHFKSYLCILIFRIFTYLFTFSINSFLKCHAPL